MFSPVPPESTISSVSTSEMRSNLLSKISILKPLDVQIKEIDTDSPNSSFSITVVAACFEGLTSEKRIQLVQAVLRKESASAVKIIAVAPGEVTPASP